MRLSKTREGEEDGMEIMEDRLWILNTEQHSKSGAEQRPAPTHEAERLQQTHHNKLTAACRAAERREKKAFFSISKLCERHNTCAVFYL